MRARGKYNIYAVQSWRKTTALTRIGVSICSVSLQYCASSFEDASSSKSDPEFGLRIEPYMYEPEESEETSHSVVGSGDIARERLENINW